MSKRLDWLGETYVFLTLDASSWYWQIEIDDRDKEETKFTLHHGLFRFLRMPFPCTLSKRAMDIILSMFKMYSALVDLKYVAIFLSSVEEHLSHVKIVIGLLLRASVSLKLKKWFFVDAYFDYLAHIVRPLRRDISIEAINAICRPKSLTNMTELKSFLVFCDVFQRFVPNFTRIGSLFIGKVGKDQPSHFGRLIKTRMEALETVQHQLMSPLIL